MSVALLAKVFGGLAQERHELMEKTHREE